MASAATESLQGAWEKGPVFLELLRMATDPDPPPLASGQPPCPPLTNETHTVLDLDSAVKWLERSRGQLGGRWGRLSPLGDFYKPSLASPKGNFGSKGR